MLRILLFVLLPFSLEAGLSQSKPQDPREGSFSIGNRPPSFTRSVDARFKSLSRAALPALKKRATDLVIAQVNISHLLESLFLLLPPEQNSFRILALSHEYSGWGRMLAEKIGGGEIKLPENLTVHIVSVNESTHDLAIERQFGKCTYHEFSNFKIDNLHNDLHEASEIDLKGGCDLIVAHDVLDKLIDPLGVFCHLHYLLRPQRGVLFTTGFPIYNEDTVRHLNHANFYDHMNANLHAFLLATGQPFLTQCRREKDKSYETVGDIILWRRDKAEIALPNIYGQSLHMNAQAGLSCTYDLSKVIPVHIPGTRDYPSKRGEFDFWGDQALCEWLYKHTVLWQEQQPRNYVWVDEKAEIITFARHCEASP